MKPHIELALSQWATEYNPTDAQEPVEYIKLFDMSVDKLNTFISPCFSAGLRGNANSWRLITTLKRNNIWCIGDVFQRETSDLLKILNLGEKGVAELFSAVEKMMHQYRKGAKQ